MNIIDIYKWIFTFLIIRLHQTYENRYYLAVDFFFIVSGFFVAKCFYTKNHSPWRYTICRIRDLYPYYILSFVIGMLIKEHTVKLRFMLWHWPEVLCLQGVGFINSDDAWSYNSPSWYISTLIFVSHILYIILSKWREKYIKCIAPIIVILLYARSFVMADSKSPTAYSLQFESILYIHANILRAFAAMNLGIISYYLAKYFYDLLIEKYKPVMIKAHRSTYVRLVTALISLCLVFGGVWQSQNIEDRRMDILCIILWFLAIIAAGIHIINIEDQHLCLGYNRKLQLAVFLNHYPLLRLGYGGWMYLMSVFVISVLEVLVVEGGKRFLYKFWVK